MKILFVVGISGSKGIKKLKSFLLCFEKILATVSFLPIANSYRSSSEYFRAMPSAYLFFQNIICSLLLTLKLAKAQKIGRHDLSSSHRGEQSPEATLSKASAWNLAKYLLLTKAGHLRWGLLANNCQSNLHFKAKLKFLKLIIPKPSWSLLLQMVFHLAKQYPLEE